MCKNFKFFNATYGPLNMDPCTDNSSTLGNLTRFQVAPSTSAGWNIQTNAKRSDQIFYQKPSVCHYFIPSFHHLEITTSFCYFLVRILPPYSSDTNDIAPVGDTPIKALAVLQFL